LKNDFTEQTKPLIVVTQISLSLDYPETSAAKVNPVFARHETFHPRFGWLKKGFDLAKQDPDIFLREDAPVRLGVGKNMVSAIRYWCNLKCFVQPNLQKILVRVFPQILV
jgi:hypothetical protein